MHLSLLCAPPCVGSVQALRGSLWLTALLCGSAWFSAAPRGSPWPSVAVRGSFGGSPLLSVPLWALRPRLSAVARSLPRRAPATPLPRPPHPPCHLPPDAAMHRETRFSTENIHDFRSRDFKHYLFFYAARLKYMEQGREQSRAYPKVEGSTTSRLACVRGVSAQIVYELEHSRGATAPVSTCIFRRRVRRLGRQVFILIESGPPAKAVEALREEIREGERKWGRSTRRTMGNAERVSSGSPRRKKCFSIGGIAYDH